MVLGRKKGSDLGVSNQDCRCKMGNQAWSRMAGKGVTPWNYGLEELVQPENCVPGEQRLGLRQSP